MDTKFTALALAVSTLIACEQPGSEGAAGTMGAQGPQGPQGPPGPAGMAAMSGSRLKVKVITAEDGAKLGAGYFDTKLGVDCAFSEAEDGKQRCLPTALAQNYVSPYVLYVDSGCTQRAALSSLCGPAVRYARFSDTCGGRERIAAVTEVLTEKFYGKGPTGGCVFWGGVGEQQHRAYRLDTILSPSEFVAGDVSMQ